MRRPHIAALPPDGQMDKVELRGHLEIPPCRDTMVGLCIGTRQTRCYDGILDRFDRRAMDLDGTHFPATGRAWSPPDCQSPARDRCLDVSRSHRLSVATASA